MSRSMPSPMNTPPVPLVPVPSISTENATSPVELRAGPFKSNAERPGAVGDRLPLPGDLRHRPAGPAIDPGVVAAPDSGAAKLANERCLAGVVQFDLEVVAEAAEGRAGVRRGLSLPSDLRYGPAGPTNTPLLSSSPANPTCPASLTATVRSHLGPPAACDLGDGRAVTPEDTSGPVVARKAACPGRSSTGRGTHVPFPSGASPARAICSITPPECGTHRRCRCSNRSCRN